MVRSADETKDRCFRSSQDGSCLFHLLEGKVTVGVAATADSVDDDMHIVSALKEIVRRLQDTHMCFDADKNYVLNILQMAFSWWNTHRELKLLDIK